MANKRTRQVANPRGASGSGKRGRKPREVKLPQPPSASKDDRQRRVSTDHTVKLPQGSGYRVAVDHVDYAAIQYDFYIPRLIWELPSVKFFIKRLDSIEAGATLFEGLTGIWKGEREGTNIYRKIIDGRKFDPNNTRAGLHAAVGRLMADLSASPEFKQDAVMFTETRINVTMGMNLRNI